MVVDRERDKDNIDICFNLEMTYVLGRYHTPYEFVVILDFSKTYLPLARRLFLADCPRIFGNG